jgi:hypothetical protein
MAIAGSFTSSQYTETPDTTTKEVIRKGIASSFYRELINPEDSFFVVLGRSFEWESISGVVIGGETVPYPTDDITTYNENLRNGYFAKRVGVNDVSLMLPLVQWKSGTRYAKYVSNANIFAEDYVFFVFTSDGSVYKCLENGRNADYTVGVPSLYEPNIKNTSEPFSLPDGYTWKYMYTVPDYKQRLITRFTDETNYIPVDRPNSNYAYGEEILQYQVQDNAIPGTVDTVTISTTADLATGTGADFSISSAKSLSYKILSGVSGATSMQFSGALSKTTNAYRDFTVTITSGPAAGISRRITSYAFNSSTSNIPTAFFTDPLPRSIPAGSYFQIAPTLTILGDGISAEGYLKLTEYPKNFGIEKYVVTNKGRNYTHATLSLPSPAGTLSGFASNANISPINGHGYDAVSELNPTYIQICVDINGGESAGTLRLADGEFRQISLVKNPLLWNSSTIAGNENAKFEEVVFRTTSASTNIEPIVAGNYIFGETTRATGRIESVRSSGRDWIILVRNLNGSLQTTKSGITGENLSIYTHSVSGAEFKRVSKDTGYVVSSVPYLGANSTNQVYKLTTTVGITGAGFDETLSLFKEGFVYLDGVSADKFNARIFSIRTSSDGTASHYVELTSVVGIDTLVNTGVGESLSMDRLDGTSVIEDDGSSSGGRGQIVSITPPDFEPLSGEVVYIENTEPKSRDRIQTERISILIKI